MQHGWMPHGMCFSWDERVLVARVTADVVIAIAYFTIPAMLFGLSRGGLGRSFRPFLLMFAAFILACGATHVMDVWTIWVPSYRLDAIVRLVTAALSVATVAALWMARPVLAVLWAQVDGRDADGGL